MRARLLIAIALGAAIGGVLVFDGTAQRELQFPHAVTGPETVRVLVAKRELNYGTQLAPKDLQWVEWPKAAVPPGSFTSVETLLGEDRKERRVVLRTIASGEPVLESKISKLGDSRRHSFSFRAGSQAVAIRVDASAGVAGFVAPGDHVDIMLIRQLDGDLVSSMIMENVPIIALDQRVNTETTGAGTLRMVTVEVDRQEAQKLALAQQVGRLSLTLRGIGENVGGGVRPVGDFGVPRGLCELPPTAATGTTTMCDVVNFPPWAP